MAPITLASSWAKAEEMTGLASPNSAYDRTTFRRRYAALRSTGVAGQRGR